MGTTFRRISKREARKRFGDNQTVILCPSKIRPGFPFGMHSTIFPDGSESWDTMYNRWHYYNASYETGYYAHYYVEEEN